tara:strand:- start:259 stop:750 length:492 start_codon:yes stop_codon:yes gene_type:complete
VIKLKKLTLRYVNKTYLKWMNDRTVFRYSDQSKYNHNIKDIKDYLKARFNSNEIIFGIFIKDRHIGNIKLGPIDYLNKASEISYFIGEKEFWGKGIGTIAIKKIIKIAKKKGIKKIIAGCVKQNKSSQRVLIKNKFKLEGELKSQYIIKNRRTTNFIYGRLIN